MFNRQHLSKQRGSITLLGALTIITGFSGFYLVMELGNKMIMDRNFDNYAQALAPVALRTELALTQAMVDNGEGNKTQEQMTDLLSRLGHAYGDDVEVTIKFGNFKPVEPYEYTDPKTGLTYTLSEEFEPLAQNASNPKAGVAEGEMPPEFSAVAIEIVESDPSGLLNFHPSGKAIYGLSSEDVDDYDVGNCYCDNRYKSCLSAVIDTSVYSPELSATIGSPNSEARKNYCDYGYVDSQQAGKAKYPSVELSSQWVGKMEEGSKVLVNETSMANLQTVLENKPLNVIEGQNPFPTYSWNFWDSIWKLWGAGDYFKAKRWNGGIYDRGDIGSSYRGDYVYEPGWSMWTDPDVLVDGYFYVGRKGTCIAGTDAAMVPNISSDLEDLSLVTDSYNTPQVQRCLSYEKTLSASTSCMFFFMCSTTTVNGYFQQSCVDYNRDSGTRLNFFQWMMSLFFAPFIDWQTSYQQLDCGVRKMRTYPSFAWPFWRT